MQLPQEDRFTVVVEGIRCVETMEFFKALDHFFSVMFMFDLKYPHKLKRFSAFVQHFFLGMRDSGVTKQMRQLYGQLLSGQNLHV